MNYFRQKIEKMPGNTATTTNLQVVPGYTNIIIVSAIRYRAGPHHISEHSHMQHQKM